jgi:hypothetical protein
MSAPQHRDRGKLGGLNRRKVVRLLAAQEISRAEIARRFDVSPSAVTQFADKHAEEINAVKAKMDDEFAGIAIADKVARMGMYQEIAERALTPTPKITNKGTVAVHVNTETGEVETIYEFDGRLAAQVGKQAAEEMGQLVQRSQVSGDLNTTTTYKIAGVDPEDLT